MKEVLILQGTHETKLMIQKLIDYILERCIDVSQSLIVFFQSRNGFKKAEKQVEVYGRISVLIYITLQFSLVDDRKNFFKLVCYSTQEEVTALWTKKYLRKIQTN